MTISQKGIDLIKNFEAYREKAYQDEAGIWTVGWGSTMWPDGNKVKKGDVMSREVADKVMAWELSNKIPHIENYIGKAELNQNQYDAICSFVYNVGVGAFRSSTLLKKLIKNPNDATIAKEFEKWVFVTKKGQKVVSNGLVNRRKKESDLYFSR